MYSTFWTNSESSRSSKVSVDVDVASPDVFQLLDEFEVAVDMVVGAQFVLSKGSWTTSIFSNLFSGAGNTDSRPAPFETPVQPRSMRAEPPAPPPKMRGPQGFAQMMNDLEQHGRPQGPVQSPTARAAGQQQRRPPNNSSSRIETFSTASESELSELSELREDAGSVGGGSVVSRGRRRVLNL